MTALMNTEPVYKFCQHIMVRDAVFKFLKFKSDMILIYG